MSATANKEFVELPAVGPYVPERPTILVLEDEVFVICPNEDPQTYVCMKRADAEKLLRNKTKIAKFVGDAGAVLRYHEDASRSVSPK